MNNIKQALESAIEVMELKNPQGSDCFNKKCDEALQVCKAALEHLQTNALDKCEPVAWISDDENFIEFRRDSLLELSYKENEIFPLYITPPQQQWVGLSGKDIDEGSKSSWVDKRISELEGEVAKAKEYASMCNSETINIGQFYDHALLENKQLQAHVNVLREALEEISHSCQDGIVLKGRETFTSRYIAKQALSAPKDKP